jgi:hypothetical protein
MTTADAQMSPMSGYEHAKERLWTEFYRLSTETRLKIIARESKYLFLFALGYQAFIIFLRHGHIVWAALFDMSAWAQTSAPPTLWSWTDAQWKLFMWIFFQIVLVVILIACVFHMLFASKTNPWVGKTATFLLGFLVRIAIPV